MVEEFKVIADLLKHLGSEGRSAFMWWLAYRAVVDLASLIIPALAIVAVAKRLAAGFIAYRKVGEK